MTPIYGRSGIRMGVVHRSKPHARSERGFRGVNHPISGRSGDRMGVVRRSQPGRKELRLNQHGTKRIATTLGKWMQATEWG